MDRISFNLPSVRSITQNDPNIHILPLQTYTDVVLESFSTYELINVIEQLQKELAFVQLDNLLIENYLQKNNPNLLIGITTNLFEGKQKPRKIQFALAAKSSKEETSDTSSIVPQTRSITTEYERKNNTIKNGNDDMTSIHTFASRGGSSLRTLETMRREHRVNYTMKIELCDKECEYLSKKQQEIRMDTKKAIRKMTAKLEDLKLTNQETLAAKCSFEELVLLNGVNELTQKIPLECFEKFIDNYIKNASTLIDKMRLKTATLKQNMIQKRTIMNIKSELSGILRPIDFDKLIIEKREYTQVIEDKTRHLIELKKVTGAASLALAKQKQILFSVEEDLKLIEQKSIDAVHQKEQLNGTYKVIENEIHLWQNKILKLQKRIQTLKAPSIFAYINCIRDLSILEKDSNAVRRRSYITTIKFKNAKKKLFMKRLQEKREREKMEMMNRQFQDIFKT